LTGPKFKIGLDKVRKICYNIFVANECYEEEKINFLAFFKAEKSNEEISLCENLTAMCEWAI